MCEKSNKALHSPATLSDTKVSSSRVGSFFEAAGNVGGRISSAIGRIFSFFKPPSAEKQHDRAVAYAVKNNNVEAGFVRDPSNKKWQKDPGVANFKHQVKDFCKDQFKEEGGTLKDMGHHEQWSNIRRDVSKGDFASLAQALKDDPTLADKLQAKVPDYKGKLEECGQKRNQALEKFQASVHEAQGGRPSSVIKAASPEVVKEPKIVPLADVPTKQVTGEIGGVYDKETFLSSEGRVQTSEIGAVDLGCTKSSDDSDYTNKGKKYCQDRAAIHAFDGGVAVCASDGVSSNKDSEVLARLATAKLNQKLADHSDVLRDLYTQGKSEELEGYVKEIFVEVQREISAELNGQDIKGATTAVAFVKIDLPGEDHSLVIGGSIGDCCATSTTIDADGHPSVELLNPQALEPSIRSQPPTLRFAKDDNHDEYLSEVRQKTHVFTKQVPKGALLETFSDGTADSLATTTPVQNKANKPLPGILPPSGKEYSALYSMGAQDKTTYRDALNELVQSTLGTSIDNADPELPLVKDVQAALQSLAKPETGLEDNQIVHKAFMSLFKRDMEQSLEAVYSNPHLDALNPSSRPVEAFNFNIPRHEAIRSLEVQGNEGIPQPLTMGVMAQRKANLLEFLTAPLRDVQGPVYRLQAVMQPKVTSDDGQFYMIDNTEANQALVADLNKAYDITKIHAGDAQRTIDLSTVHTENDKICIPINIDYLRPKNVEDVLGVKVDDVCNAVIAV